MQKINARFGFEAREKNVEAEAKLPAPVLRPAARAVVLDQDDRILLLRFDLDGGRIVWAAPGGGLESVREALSRELREEVGLEAPADAPHLWHQIGVREGLATGFDGVVNDYFLIRTDTFDSSGTMTPDELAAENAYGHHWWTLEELQSHQGPAVLSPRHLLYLLEKLRTEGPPETPVFLGI